MNARKRIVILLISGACAIGFAMIFRDDIHAFVEQRRLTRLPESPATPDSLSAPAHAIRIPESVLGYGRIRGIPPRYGYSAEAFARYSDWIDQAIHESHDRPAIIIDKLARSLELWIDGEKKEVFPVDLGRDPVNDKFIQGDGATPEGRYRVSWVRDIGQTRYYRAYMLDYPNPADLGEFNALKAKNRFNTTASPGGDIEIHGNGGMGIDWTLGCIALPNTAMDRLFSYDLKSGTPVTIVRYGTKEKYEVSRR
jgi:hypothetical protein